MLQDSPPAKVPAEVKLAPLLVLTYRLVPEMP